MQEWLTDYHDQRLIDYLRYGWPLNAEDTEINETYPDNQAGARSHPDEVRAYLKQELDNGSVIGPFIHNPFGKIARFSPLDAIPKKESDDMRIILNLSHPFEGGLVNSSINNEIYQEDEDMCLKYPSVDDLARIVKKKGRACKIMKRDLAKVYHQLFCCPGLIHLLGYSFKDRLYFNVTLSMGSRSSAYCCQRTTSAITYICQTTGFRQH